ncbi:hypothetical protein ACGFYV_16225 [Streptomyces sp. NPDC048297]|uniref:hypothetical protein n=1 Tax=Streptomyces sp. NPDC048297 TaxID=3365531 RepID=UPI003721D7AB
MISAAASVAALALFVASCSSGGTGARDEGPAHASAVAGAVTSPSAAPSETYKRVDAVALLRADPKVSESIKRDLQPCGGDDYPVDVTYGDLTGGSVNDVVVNVLTCGDWVGLGTYVYRDVGGTYKNVFRTEESPVYAEIDGADLTVTKQVYATDDALSNPSRETVITYSWKAGRFTQVHTHETDYSKAGGGDTATPTPVPDN